MSSSLPTDYRDFIDWQWPQLEPHYQNLIERSLSVDNVTTWLADWSQLGKLVRELQARLSLAASLNTADAEAEHRYLTFVSEVFPQVQAAEQKLKQKLLDGQLAPEEFEIPLRNLRAETALFREANLPLFVEERKLETQYDKITGAQAIQWNEQELTMPQVRTVLHEPDRTVRERVWRLAAERWLADRAAINDLWVKSQPLRRQIAHNANCADYRAYVWQQRLRFDYTPADCETLHRAIEEEVVPAASRIYAAAQRELGVDTLRPWDLDEDRDPLHLPTLHPFQNVDELIVKSEWIFQQVDPQLGRYYTTMRRERLLDLDSRKGKAPGGYCTEFPVAQRPFIFMNAVGVPDDVHTMIHESGHAFHVFETNHLPYIQQLEVTMEFAEVASIAMELLAAPYLSEQYGGFYAPRDAALDRAEHLERMILFWPYMAVVDAFQHWAHTSPDGSDPEACDAKWAELQRHFLPGVDWSGLETEMMTGWHRKLHIHVAPFYYVEYGLALLGAVQVWRNALRDQAGAVAQYRRALALGGTKSLPELYAAAGAKFAFDAETMREAVELIETTIEQLQV